MAFHSPGPVPLFVFLLFSLLFLSSSNNAENDLADGGHNQIFMECAVKRIRANKAMSRVLETLFARVSLDGKELFMDLDHNSYMGDRELLDKCKEDEAADRGSAVQLNEFSCQAGKLHFSTKKSKVTIGEISLGKDGKCWGHGEKGKSNSMVTKYQIFDCNSPACRQRKLIIFERIETKDLLEVGKVFFGDVKTKSQENCMKTLKSHCGTTFSSNNKKRKKRRKALPQVELVVLKEDKTADKKSEGLLLPKVKRHKLFRECALKRGDGKPIETLVSHVNLNEGHTLFFGAGENMYISKSKTVKECDKVKYAKLSVPVGQISISGGNKLVYENSKGPKKAEFHLVTESKECLAELKDGKYSIFRCDGQVCGSSKLLLLKRMPAEADKEDHETIYNNLMPLVKGEKVNVGQIQIAALSEDIWKKIPKKCKKKIKNVDLAYRYRHNTKLTNSRTAEDALKKCEQIENKNRRQQCIAQQDKQRHQNRQQHHQQDATKKNGQQENGQIGGKSNLKKKTKQKIIIRGNKNQARQNDNKGKDSSESKENEQKEKKQKIIIGGNKNQERQTNDNEERKDSSETKGKGQLKKRGDSNEDENISKIPKAPPLLPLKNVLGNRKNGDRLNNGIKEEDSLKDQPTATKDHWKKLNANGKRTAVADDKKQLDEGVERTNNIKKQPLAASNDSVNIRSTNVKAINEVNRKDKEGAEDERQQQSQNKNDIRQREKLKKD